MGKSTLLKMIASKELKIPPRIDVLYVEQEVSEWMDGWMDGWVDGWMDGWIDG